MFREIVIALLDENTCLQEVALERVLELGRERALAEDKVLGIERDCIPFRLIQLPNTLNAYDCHKLAEKIRAVAQFDIVPEDKDQNQALWMRCVQLYWQVKAIRLPNLVFPVIPDPLRPGGPLSQILPSQDIENLKLETEADQTL